MILLLAVLCDLASLRLNLSAPLVSGRPTLMLIMSTLIPIMAMIRGFRGLPVTNRTFGVRPGIPLKRPCGMCRISVLL